MAQMVRALRQSPMFQKQLCGYVALHRFPASSSPCVTKGIDLRRFSSATVHSARRDIRYRSKGLGTLNGPTPTDLEEDKSVNDDSDAKKSRNQQKREARRAVQWGMELAAFSTPQIKRILRAASLERDVFDALMLVKRLGRDVREGKRRQFNYIGKLLRDVQPELMDSLIQATKDGDQSMLQALSGSMPFDEDDDAESEYEEEEENPHIDIVTRWLEGLIRQDNDITNEIYSLQDVEFDRQELRKLVRRVHSEEENKAVIDENTDAVNMTITSSRKSLTRFLCRIAKQLPS